MDAGVDHAGETEAPPGVDHHLVVLRPRRLAGDPGTASTHSKTLGHFCENFASRFSANAFGPSSTSPESRTRWMTAS